jgi:hypothetical protein
MSVTRNRPGHFILSESRAAGSNFAENYPVEDDHSAALAIDSAIGDGLVICPDGYSISVDLLANLDGEIDSYRILARPDGAPWFWASEMECIMPGTEPDTMTVLREAVTAANALLAAAKERD